MAMVRLLNQYNDTGNAVPWWISHVLAYLGGSGAGWTIDMSGSGVGGLYSGTGDVFDRTGKNPVRGALVTDIGVGVGSEHFGGGSCWIVFGDPNGRQWLFQRHVTAGDSRDDEWMIWVSPGGNFTGGDASTRPTASDEHFLWYYTTGATSPIFQTGNVSNLIHVVADSTPTATGEYGFWCAEFVATNTYKSFICQDPYTDLAPGDPLPILYWAMPTGVMNTTYLSSTSYYPYVITEYGLAGEARRATNLPYLVNVYPGAGGNSLYDSKERPYPVAVTAPVAGFLGHSYWCRWAGVNRSYPDTRDGLTMIDIQAMVVDGWDGSTVPGTI